VSRARTRYIYKNSMELSRKKNTRDFRLTTSHLDGHHFTMSYELIVSRQLRHSNVLCLIIVNIITVIFPDGYIHRGGDILDSIISATIQQHDHRPNTLPLVPHANATSTQPSTIIRPITSPSPFSQSPELPHEQLQQTSTRQTSSHHLQYPSVLINTTSDTNPRSHAYDESIQRYLTQLQGLREAYRQAAGSTDERE
jgi:hypothetical protein